MGTKTLFITAEINVKTIIIGRRDMDGSVPHTEKITEDVQPQN